MLLGKRLGDYILVRKIATGGMAEVHLAIKRGPGVFDRMVALKTILPHRTDDQSFVQMFYKEARLGARFNHPHLINVFDVEVLDDTLTMVMEYVPGATVAELVKRVNETGGELRRAVGLRIVLDACLGLHHAHHLCDLDGTALEVVHRDVSPQNILVGFGGQVKVFDFGIAQASGNNGEGESLAGVLAGKYAYMSPEQAQGGHLDERSDVFSLGILLYELTTRQRLFRRKNQIEVLRALSEEPINPPSSIMPGYPRGLERVVMAALERDPKKRPSTAQELHDGLLKYAALADENLSTSALGEFMGKTFQTEIQADQLLIQATLERLREGPELERASARRRSGRLDAPPSPEPGEGSRVQVKEMSALDEALELGALGAKSVEDSDPKPTPKAAVRGSEDADVALHGALSQQIGRSRRLNLTLAIALVLALVGGGVATVLLLSDRHADRVAAATLPRGQLDISSDPPGATIFIDEVQRAELTPALIEVPLDGPLQVRVTLDGHPPATATLRATAESPRAALHVVLAPEAPPAATGAVRVVATPAQATVLIDGEVIGVETPLLIADLALGVEHVLRVERDGFEPRIVPFQLHSPTVREFLLELQSAVDLGNVSVYTEPAGARVLVNGELAGLTPLESLPLVSGRDFQLELQLDGYRPTNLAINLQPNQNQVIQERLIRPRRPGGRPADGLAEPQEGVELTGTAPGTDETPRVEPLPEQEEEESPYELMQ